ncbi:MAG: hypothetical protein A2X59_00225 [Nitrospirae bacterium GWC2_42_7]|nr:MAG: hypothetical protein A2X59_00225 [Nitrospirae bacterium GWC2_42_7]
MLIAVDIGNSSINIGYFTKTSLIVQHFDTIPLKNATEYRRIICKFMSQNHLEKNIFNVIISSVVLSHTSVLKQTFKDLIGKEKKKIMIISHKMNTGLRFNIHNPEKLGTDRIAAAVGACEIYEPPVAVLNFGTATTITIVDKHRNYIGGSIMPGVGLMNESLDMGTSRLKKISLRPPSSALGTDTTDCISSGLFYGTAGAAERILDEIEKQTGSKFKIIITGGHGTAMDKFIKRHHKLDPDLTLKGLKIIYEKN